MEKMPLDQAAAAKSMLISPAKRAELLAKVGPGRHAPQRLAGDDDNPAGVRAHLTPSPHPCPAAALHRGARMRVCGRLQQQHSVPHGGWREPCDRVQGVGFRV